MSKASSMSYIRIAIFVTSVLLIGIFAGLNYHMAQGLGGLLFILSPALVTIAMRAFTRDGWADAGLGWPIGGAKSFLAAVALFPAVLLFVLATGWILGFVQFGQNVLDRLIIAVLTGAPVFLVYASSEEFAWRGYLEPKLSAAGVSALPRHLLVGLIWAIWHVGYVLSEVNPSVLPPLQYFSLFLLGCLAMAVIYGQWRAKTGTFWPAAIAHGVANSLAWPLTDPDLVQIALPVWFAARPEGLLFLASLSVMALVTFRRRAQ